MGGPVTWERGIFRQNIFCNIILYMESAHKTNERNFNFQFSAFIKWLLYSTILSSAMYYSVMWCVVFAPNKTFIA